MRVHIVGNRYRPLVCVLFFSSSRPSLSSFFFFNPNKQASERASTPYIICMCNAVCVLLLFIERSETEHSVIALVHNQFRRHWSQLKATHILFFPIFSLVVPLLQSIQLMWRVSVGHLNLWCYCYNGKLIKISSNELERGRARERGIKRSLQHLYYHRQHIH